MITKFSIKNFKRLEDVEIDLSARVVLVGPNNSGKTTFLQAISIWDIAWHKWLLQNIRTKDKTQTTITINRNDILSAPLPSAIHLWRDLHVQEQSTPEEGKKATQNIRFELCAEGYTLGMEWKLGLEFDYANPESIYCRIIEEKTSSPFPFQIIDEKIGFLPPMAGLSPFEDLLIKDVMFRKIGEGKTAEVLRNLLWLLYKENKIAWKKLCDDMKNLFAVELQEPKLSEAGGLLTMGYRENGSEVFDLSSSGRGFQQMLLILSFLYSANTSVLLLDEPDAHLEVLRQKEVFKFLAKAVAETNSQIIIATHSETVLDEAAQTSQVIAFIGQPHTVNKNQELKKSLNLIGYTDYLHAERLQKVVYLEGSTDFDLLCAFAELLDHPVLEKLNRIFVKYLSNNHPDETYAHFYGLKEAYKNIIGWALYDKIDNKIGERPALTELMWSRREFENYLNIPQVLRRWAVSPDCDDLRVFNPVKAMEDAIINLIAPAYLEDPTDDWWRSEKASDNIIARILAKFYKDIGLPVLLNKGDYYRFVTFMEPTEVDPEVIEKLDSLNDFLRA